MQLFDQGARDTIRTALDKTLVVEAAAGTGKTSELVQRIIAVVAAGRTTIDRIAGVTFTEKAAGELKLRLRAELENARRAAMDQNTRNNLEQALAHLEEARLSTIHSFCGDLLRERPVEARIDPQFELMTESQSLYVYREAFRTWFERKLEDLPEGTRRALRRKTGNSQTEILISAGWELSKWRDFSAKWRRPEFNRQAAIDAIVEKIHELAGLTSDPSDPSNNLFRDTALFRTLSENIRAAERARSRDYDGSEAVFVVIASDRGPRKLRLGPAQFSKQVKRDDILALHNELVTVIDAFASDSGSDIAALLQAELGETVTQYQLLKERAGKLDFLDLLIRSRDLLVQFPSVRKHFQERFTHIFVDEFQDTDPLQAEIIILLSSPHSDESNWRGVTPMPGKLFIVGDPKQAIYRFRRADVGTYEEVKQLLLRNGAVLLQLTTSFRSVPSIQAMINRAFTPYMDGNAENLQAGYVPLSPFRQEYTEQPSIAAMPVPRPYKKKFSMQAVEESLPDATAAFVAWLVEKSGWTVPKPGTLSERIPLGPQHVCLLFRRFISRDDDVARPYIRALEARNLPHLLVGGKSFHDREEVQTIRAALTAIEWPEDELSVFATLRGSLFAIRDDVLLEYRHRVGRFHPFRLPAEPLEGELREVVGSLRILQELHRNRNYRPAAETLDMLLEETRAQLAFALRPSGEQVLANVLHIAELARKYEASGGLSFRGFVEQVRAGAGAAEAGEAPIFEEGSEGIRMMSVHKAKGLEFPVVILADITAKICQSHPSRYIDASSSLCAVPLAGCAPLDLLERGPQELARDRAEGIRLAYVAATRARDLLVIPTIGDDPRGSWDSVENWWVRPLYDALYPETENRQRAGKPPACPQFGKDSVLIRPPDLTVDEKDTVWPGLHRFQEPETKNTGYGVTWWDPRALTLNVPQSFGIRQEELLKEADDPEILKKDLESYRNWQTRWDEVRQRAAQPSIVFRTATAQARIEPDLEEPDRDVQVIELSRDSERPAGARFGALVHATLAAVPLDASTDQVEEITALYARVLGGDDRETDAAAAAVESALAHPLILRAREAVALGACRRETPITLTLADGSVVEGILDLAFLEKEGWTVVDFKTDRELEKELERYKRQVGLYRRSIEQATGQPCAAILIRV
ncbi:MAG: UvrD-helicase domain-containing protein [Silvibacterium sp.]